MNTSMSSLRNIYGMGGFLPLHINITNDEFYNDAIRLNSARNAILLSMKDGHFTKALIPYYLCAAIGDTLKKHGYDIEYYHINNDFSPILNEKQLSDVKSKKNVIIVVNYFGVFFPAKTFDAKINLIVDNTQAFYEPPINYAYNVYSCRKFFGVSDGAYLIKEGIKSYNLMQDYSSERAAYLLKTFERGTDSVYQEYLAAENDINNSDILEMSILTRSILKSINYNKYDEIRLNNFNVLHNGLGDINTLSFDLPVHSPMVYPFLIQNDEIRSKLIKNNIFIPQWWKWCIKAGLCNEFEGLLSKYLIPLPIDQRYSDKDMTFIVNFIKSLL